jgi:hypothetical protein
MARNWAGERFRAVLKALTSEHGQKRQAAKAAGKSSSWMTGVLNGQQDPKFQAISDIAEHFQLDVADFFTQPPPDPLRPTSYVKSVPESSGGIDADPLVRAFRAIIKEDPTHAAEALAAFFRRGETPQTPTPKPKSRRTSRKSRGGHDQ